MTQTGSDNSSSRRTPPSALMSSSASSSITSTMSSKVITPTSRLLSSTTGARRDRSVEQARHVLLDLGDLDGVPLVLEQLLDRHRPLGAQQAVKGHRPFRRWSESTT